MGKDDHKRGTFPEEGERIGKPADGPEPLVGSTGKYARAFHAGRNWEDQAAGRELKKDKGDRQTQYSQGVG